MWQQGHRHGSWITLHGLSWGRENDQLTSHQMVVGKSTQQKCIFVKVNEKQWVMETVNSRVTINMLMVQLHTLKASYLHSVIFIFVDYFQMNALTRWNNGKDNFNCLFAYLRGCSWVRSGRWESHCHHRAIQILRGIMHQIKGKSIV